MKKKVLDSSILSYKRFLLLFSVFVLFAASSVMAATINVDDSGGADYTTIQAAIDAASNGDTIIVGNGIYNENVNINKPLTLKGAQHSTTPVGGRSGAESIIDGGTTTAVSISASNVVLDGFTITIANKADSKQVGVIIANNALGISDVTVKNNIIEDISDGADVGDDHTYGILVWGTTNGPSNINILNNVIQNVEEYGIAINDLSSDITIDGNSITNMLTADRTATVGTNLGVAIGIGGSDPGPTTVTITDNILNTGLTGTGMTSGSPGGVGIGMAHAPTSVTVTNNEITGNSEGIAVQSTTAPIVHSNNICGNSAYGVHNYGTTNIDAKYNWWGAADGPSHSPGSGDKVSDNVDYDPWYVDSIMSTLSTVTEGLDSIESKLDDPAFGLEEIKKEVSNIESEVTGSTIASSTMYFQGTLTDNLDGTFSGVLPMIDEGGTDSGYDIYAKEGATAWFGDAPGPVWTYQIIGADHDAWPTWTPDTPDWYQYSLELDGAANKWAVRNHPGATAVDPWSSNPTAYPPRGVPMSGSTDWNNMYAT